jgi:hypothetical protein
MELHSAQARLRELLDQFESFRLCGPSDDPDEQTAVVYGFRALLAAIKRASKVIRDVELRREVEAVFRPDELHEVYDAHAMLNALLPELREDIESPSVGHDIAVAKLPAKEIRVFISYSTLDKTIAGQVKKFFASLKIAAFLAHDDIEVSQEWKDRIVEELLLSNVVIPILSRSFKSSEWTSQEIGFAFGKGNVLFIPLSIDGTTPYGFISHIQGKPIRPEGLNYDLITEPLINHFPHMMIPLLIERMAGAMTYRDAEGLMMPLVPHFNKFNDQEINAFAEASAGNGQIWDAKGCKRDYLPKFLALHEARVDTSTLKRLRSQIK